MGFSRSAGRIGARAPEAKQRFAHSGKFFISQWNDSNRVLMMSHLPTKLSGSKDTDSSTLNGALYDLELNGGKR